MKFPIFELETHAHTQWHIYHDKRKKKKSNNKKLRHLSELWVYIVCCAVNEVIIRSNSKSFLTLHIRWILLGKRINQQSFEHVKKCVSFECIREYNIISVSCVYVTILGSIFKSSSGSSLFHGCKNVHALMGVWRGLRVKRTNSNHFKTKDREHSRTMWVLFEK